MTAEQKRIVSYLHRRSAPNALVEKPVSPWTGASPVTNGALTNSLLRPEVFPDESVPAAPGRAARGGLGPFSQRQGRA
jgi:hypothetical protein